MLRDFADSLVYRNILLMEEKSKEPGFMEHTGENTGVERHVEKAYSFTEDPDLKKSIQMHWFIFFFFQFSLKYYSRMQ